MARVALARSRALLPRAAALSSPSFSTAAPFSSSSRAAAVRRVAAAPSSSHAAAAASSAAPGAGGEAAVAPAARKRWGLLKFGTFAALAGTLGGAGYVSYAYTLAEVDQKTTEFRMNMVAPPVVAEGASEFEKFRAMAYSTAKKAPVAAIELYLDIRSTIEGHVMGFTEPTSDKLLPDLHPQQQHVFTLVLDLNETLIHSDWQRGRGWRTFKRPGVDAFLEHMANFYEVVVYSDQIPTSLEPIIDRLDTKGCISARLSRPATKYQDGKHYRDLSKLNRNPAQVLYVSAHALESCLQLENCVTIKPWKLENDDTQLLDLIPFLEYLAMASPPDVRAVLASYQGRDVAKEFAKRSKEIERLKQERQQHKSIWRR